MGGEWAVMYSHSMHLSSPRSPSWLRRLYGFVEPYLSIGQGDLRRERFLVGEKRLV